MPQTDGWAHLWREIVEGAPNGYWAPNVPLDGLLADLSDEMHEQLPGGTNRTLFLRHI